MFAKDVWYIAGHSEELAPGGLLGRTVAGDRVVLCRRRDGRVYALEDRCPHRRAPLSLGEMVDGDDLRCPYHGITFDSSGRCVAIPGQDHIPPRWRIRAFPVIEKYRYLWVWTGDPTKCADESSIPKFLELGEAPYTSRSGLIPVDADYRLLVDNLLDPTHAEFIHRTSFGSSDWQAARDAGAAPERQSGEFELDLRDDGIDFVFHLSDVLGGPCFGKAYALRNGEESYSGGLDIRMDVSWQPPGLFLYGIRLKPAGTGEAETLHLVNLHLVTPATEFTTHYFYRCSVLGGDARNAVADFWHDVDVRAFHEDKRILEAQQRVIGERDLFDETLWSVQGDQMSLKGRKILNAMSGAEAVGRPARAVS